MDEPDAKDSRGKGRAGHQGPQDTVGESDFAQELVGCDVVRPEGPVSHSLALWGAGGLDRVGLRQRARQDRCGQAEPLMGMESSTRCRSHGGRMEGLAPLPTLRGRGREAGRPRVGPSWQTEARGSAQEGLRRSRPLPPFTAASSAMHDQNKAHSSPLLKSFPFSLNLC